MRWPSAWFAGCSCALLLAGCGGHKAAAPGKPPPIPPAVAQQLAADADAVSGASSACGAYDAATKLQRDTIASIARVPARYREQLMSAANDLAARIPPCMPPQPKPKEDHHGHGHGHGKHKKHGEGD